MIDNGIRKAALLMAKATFSVALILFALRGIDTATVYEHLRAADAAAVALAIALTTAISVLHAYRWQLILGPMGHGVAFADCLKLVLIGYFFNQTLPSTIGGDAFRAWGLNRLGIRAGDAVTSVVVDRIFALISLIIMILFGAPWLFELVHSASARWAIAAIVASGAIGTAALLSFARFSSRFPKWRATTFLAGISRVAGSVAVTPLVATKVFLLTLAGYSALSFSVHLLARNLGVPLGLGNSLLFIPLVTLITVLPVSIAGWGLRESAMVVALGLIGVSRVQAFSVSVLFGLVVMMSGVPGGFIWLWTGHRIPPPGPNSREVVAKP